MRASFCKGKIELDNDDHRFGTCCKCSAYIQTKRCTETRLAKLVLATPSLEVTTLVTYSSLLDAIVGKKPLTMKNLMTTKPFDCTYNMYHVVTSVSHLNVLRVEVILLRVEVILLQVEAILLQVEARWRWGLA